MHATVLAQVLHEIRIPGRGLLDTAELLDMHFRFQSRVNAFIHARHEEMSVVSFLHLCRLCI